MTTAAVRRLPLDQQHRELGARFAPFAGWEMPVQYSGIVEEHRAVRESAGVFDVSHMGRLFVTGKDAGRLLRRALTYKVDQLDTGEAHYALYCAEDGGILDDIFVYRLDADRFLVVGNAANADAGRDRLASFVERGMDVEAVDRQENTCMLALQGPRSPELLSRVIGEHVPSSVRRRRCMELEFMGYKLFVSRTGYTGEDGFELVTSTDTGKHILERLTAEGAAPCGLGARDTLRLEAALHLYGNDIDASTNPWEAGLGFAVSLDDGAGFAGREALAAAREAGVARRLACVKAMSRGIMRAECSILHGGEAVGRVTSGGFSPMLNTSIGMGYVPVDLAKEGTELQVDVRGRPLPVTVIPRPFYRRQEGKRNGKPPR